MKTAAFAALSALTLSACAPAMTSAPPADFDAAATTWIGWAKFSGEEFRLYPDQTDSRQGFSQACVSGALPRDLQRQARQDLSGARVEVTGRAVAWSADLPGDRLDHQGSNITNECRKDVVILASRVTAN
ncbi:hypothetical protein [Brevundimonas sp.]|jgi:hypothetical protein|uniref:hypothetical protein n=1 Tax=Brevundimonas sp. TaxID=1871086 RepID=UPI002E0D21F5|nr:hypothetical protein [Brevundimonas sp.]